MYVCSNCKAQLDAQGMCLACGKEHTFQTALLLQDEEQQQGFQQQGFPQQGFQQQGFPQQGFPQQGFQPQQQAQSHSNKVSKPSLNTLALVSLVLAGLCILPGFFILGFLFGIAAVVSLALSVISLKQIKKTGGSGRVLALIASIVSIVCIVTTVVSFVLVGVGYHIGKQTYNYDMQKSMPITIDLNATTFKMADGTLFDLSDTSVKGVAPKFPQYITAPDLYAVSTYLYNRNPLILSAYTYTAQSEATVVTVTGVVCGIYDKYNGAYEVVLSAVKDDSSGLYNLPCIVLDTNGAIMQLAKGDTVSITGNIADSGFGVLGIERGTLSK